MDENEGERGVNIGEMAFSGGKDSMLCLKQDLPPYLPFCCSMDPYNFLNRVLQSRDGNGSKNI